ncbi:MAG: hypothetical protein U0U66_04785 [Cytophagaceae bacterium]
MKTYFTKTVTSIVFILSIVFLSTAVVSSPPESKKGKHHSHKKAKKQKSKYLFNFQH